MKAVAIVSGWIACMDETGKRCAIPSGTRIRIESRANGYRVSWRDLSGRRRAARGADDELNLYRSRALRAYLEAILRHAIAAGSRLPDGAGLYRWRRVGGGPMGFNQRAAPAGARLGRD